MLVRLLDAHAQRGDRWMDISAREQSSGETGQRGVSEKQNNHNRNFKDDDGVDVELFPPIALCWKQRQSAQSYEDNGRERRCNARRQPNTRLVVGVVRDAIERHAAFAKLEGQSVEKGEDGVKEGAPAERELAS